MTSNVCANCHRKNTAGTTTIRLRLVNPSCINMRKKFSLFKRRPVRSRQLCGNCYVYLCTNEHHINKYAWSAYVWNFLARLVNGTTISQRWQALPQSWHLWWKDEAVRLLNVNFAAAGPPLFVERTSDREEFLTMLKELKLGDIMRTCNRLLYPDILCPWGCTEYIHKVHCVTLDVVWEHFFSINVAEGHS